MVENLFGFCLICGEPATEFHHTTPKKLGGKHKVPICLKHHMMIENVKYVIMVMEKQQKVSIKKFRQIIDSMKELGELI